MIVTLFLVLTYLVSPIAAFGVARLVLGKNFDVDLQRRNILAVISLGLGPLLISRILIWLFEVFPGRTEAFYLWTVFVLLLVPAAMGWSSFFKTRIHSLAIGDEGRLSKLLRSVLMLGVVLLLASILLLCMSSPLLENDPLKYATLGRLFFDSRSTDFYPMTQGDAATGFYVITSHPLGHEGLICWSYLIQGSSESFGWARLISPYYLICTALLIYVLLLPTGSWAAWIGVAFFICMPGYLYVGVIHHLDSLRIFFFLASFALAVPCLESGRLRECCYQGILVGAGLFCHSSGLVILPLLAILCVFCSRVGWSRRVQFLFVVGLVAIVVGGEQYVQNFYRYGSPVFDFLPLGQLEHIQHQEFLNRGRGFTTLDQRILGGVLRGFTDLRQFGMSFWLFLVAVILVRPWPSFPSIFLVSIVLVSAYLVLAFVTVIFGIDYFISSYRYLMAIHPLIAIGIGFVFARMFVFARKNQGLQLGAAGLSVILLAWIFRDAYSLLHNRYQRISPQVASIMASDWDIVQRMNESPFPLIQKVHQETKRESVFLVFRPMEFSYYGQRKMYRNFDPRMEPVYTAKSPIDAYAELQRLGIEYVFGESNWDPTRINTELGPVLGSPEFSQTVSQDRDWWLLRLREDRLDVGRREIWRQSTSQVALGTTQKYIVPGDGHLIPVDSNKGQQIVLDLQGTAFLVGYLVELNAQGQALASTRIWNLPAPKSFRPVSRLLQVQPQTTHIWIELICEGEGSVEIQGLRLYEY